jgi:hypothetical protein
MRALTALLAILLLGVVPAAAPAASAYDQVAGSLALIGYPVSDEKLTIAFGTGFCVSTSAAKSYFVTANHVISDGLGNTAKNLFVILPKNPAQRYKATVVRHSAEPDLAIVSIDAPCDATVKVSQRVPDVFENVGIVGFPYVEVCEQAGLCNPKLLLSGGHKGQLIPVATPGSVNQASGTSFIMYSGDTDHGNSGGPLFDLKNGVVYGVVVDILPGYSDEGAPPQANYNRAIPLSGPGFSFVNGAPVTVALDATGGSVRGFMNAGADRYKNAALGSASCRRAWRDLDEGYGEWAQLHGRIVSYAAFVRQPAHEGRKAQLQPLAVELSGHEATLSSKLRAALKALEASKATTIVGPASELVDAVDAGTADDASLAASLGAPAKPGEAQLAKRLDKAAEDMDSVTACI